MCITLTVHRTCCETRRQVIVNPLTGLTIYHPFEQPPPCCHYSVFQPGGCPSHGSCCISGSWQLCFQDNLGQPCYGWQTYHVTASEGSPFVTWPDTEPTEPKDMRVDDDQTMEMQSIRRWFFNAGAELFEYREAGLRPTIPGRIDAFGAWSRKAFELSQLKELWEFYTGTGDLEICPVSAIAGLHPWGGIFQFAERAPGFPLNNGFVSFYLPDIPEGCFSYTDFPEEDISDLTTSSPLEEPPLWPLLDGFYDFPLQGPTPPLVSPPLTDIPMRQSIALMSPSMASRWKRSANPSPSDVLPSISPLSEGRSGSPIEFNEVDWENGSKIPQQQEPSPHGSRCVGTDGSIITFSVPPTLTLLQPKPRSASKELVQKVQAWNQAPEEGNPSFDEDVKPMRGRKRRLSCPDRGLSPPFTRIKLNHLEKELRKMGSIVVPP